MIRCPFRSATVRPAEFLGTADSLGTVRVGNLADLVLLEDNPLDDIENVRHIRGVVLDGAYYDRSTLDRLLEEVTAEVHREPTGDSSEAGDALDSD